MRRLYFLCVATLCGCTSLVDGEPSPTTSGSSSSGSTAVPPPPPAPSTSTSSGSTSTSAPGSSSSTSGFDTADGGFNIITDPDAGPVFIECSTAEQDCAEDQKCNAWSNDEAPLWNAIKCFPLDPAADAPGEPCSVEEGPFSGVDSCAVGSLCWGVDPLTLEGTCTPYCSGADLSCEDTSSVCNVSDNEILQLCLPTCSLVDPSSCNAGFVCRVDDNIAQCFPLSPGTGAGVFETCEDTSACAPGLRCIDGAGVGLCAPKAPACCTPYCDLEQPMCPRGTACLPIFDAKTQPALAEIGVCGQPDR